MRNDIIKYLSLPRVTFLLQHTFIDIAIWLNFIGTTQQQQQQQQEQLHSKSHKSLEEHILNFVISYQGWSEMRIKTSCLLKKELLTKNIYKLKLNN